MSLAPVDHSNSKPGFEISSGSNSKESLLQAFNSVVKMVNKTIPGSLSHTEGRVALNEQRALKTTSLVTIGVVFAAGNVATGGVLGLLTLTAFLGLVMVKAFANAQVAKESSRLLINESTPKAIESSKETDLKELKKVDISKEKKVSNAYSAESAEIRKKIKMYKDDNIDKESMLKAQSEQSSGSATLMSNIAKNNEKIAGLEIDLLNELKSDFKINLVVAKQMEQKGKTKDEAASLRKANEGLGAEIRDLEKLISPKGNDQEEIQEQKISELNEIISNARIQRDQLKPGDNARSEFQKVMDEATSKLSSLLTEKE